MEKILATGASIFCTCLTAHELLFCDNYVIFDAAMVFFNALMIIGAVNCKED